MINDFRKELEDKILKKTAKIGIIGLGYVGLPLALSFTEVQLNVIGFDIDSTKVDILNKGTSYIKHIGEERLKKALKKNLFEATSDFSKATEVDALILCVPTPLNNYKEPDISYIVNSMDAILPYLRKGQIISLESTTYPGTTDEELKSRLEKKGFKVGEDIFLVYSPEREDPGNKSFSTSTIPKVVGGFSQNCLELGKKLYGSVINKVVPVSSTKAAELTKLLENIYRAVNISLVNEMKMIADKMDVNIWEVIDAAATKPFGFTPFYPGPGLGGHCIPIDPFYLSWKAKEFDINTHFIELAGEINTRVPNWIVSKITDAFNQRGMCLKGSKILMLGITYKKNIDDMRESPAVKLIDLLAKKEAVVSYHDPYIPVFPKMRKYHFDLKSVDLDEKTLSEADCVIIAADHDCFDYDYIQKHSRLVVDTRGRYSNINDEKIVKC